MKDLKTTVRAGSALHAVIREVTAAIRHLPEVSSRMAWRLHPDDWKTVRDELSTYENKSLKMRQTSDSLNILGIAVLKDPRAVRLSAD
jgi:hypothetical protein